jgi:hypothetical protein
MSDQNLQVFLNSPNLLETIATETDRNDESAHQLVADISEQQLNWKPAVDRWSIAECIDHLAVSGAAFKSYLTGAISRGRARFPVRTAPAYQPTWMGGWLARQLLPENTRRLPAPKLFRPSEASVIHGSLDRYLAQHAELRRFVGDTCGIDFNKTRLRSPVTPLIRYSIADAYVVMVVHAWRHLAQASRVRSAEGFANQK